MAKLRGDRKTDDLFDQPPGKVAIGFHEPKKVQASSLSQRISMAVSVILKECEEERDVIAQKMSEYLGDEVTKNMLDAYASPSRDTHNISLERAFALFVVTGDARIFGMELSSHGFSVIANKYVAAVEEAMWAEREEIAQKERLAARKRWKGATS